MTPGDVGPQPEAYPHLAPELRTLAGDALRLWGDAGERRRALEAIVAAWETDRADLAAAVARVDEAVVAGLQALGLPRGPVRDVRVEFAGRGWLGHKGPDCILALDGIRVHRVVRSLQDHDRVFHSWVHESLHGRRLYAEAFAAEYRRYRGYEEGMVEGLTRLIIWDKAGMNPGMVSFDYYVGAYRTVARALGIEAEGIWRELWQYPPGTVRAAFVDVIADRLRRLRRRTLTAAQRAKLRSLADRQFDSDRLAQLPSEDALTTLWQVALR